MKFKKFFILFTAIFLFCFVLSASAADDKSYSVPLADFDITINENGAATIRETWTVKFEKGSFKRFYKDICSGEYADEKYTVPTILSVTADGSLMPCRRLPFVIGNIKNGEVADIIRNIEIMKKLAASKISENCLVCTRFFKCRGGAKCITYAQTGSLEGPDINCFYR